MQIYQDIWVNGKVETKGIRDCSNRYALIRSLCAKYQRPFTVLDIGTNLGYFSFRLAYEFDCRAVMVERKGVYLDKLLEVIARQDKRDHLTLLSGDLNLAILNQLGTCEHFDVVL
ncbi:MAG: hypothetical protein AB7E32_05705, partial [Desulfovibrio sp.]